MAEPPSHSVDELVAAFERFRGALDDAVESVRASPTFPAEGEAARGYLHLLRSLMKSVERELVHSPDRPRFRVLDDRVRSGGDNPDQRYWFAHIEPGGRYRVRGRLGSARRIEVQLYSREPYGAEDVSVGYLTHEQMALDADGRFAVEIGPQPFADGPWLDSGAAAIVQVREIYASWADTVPAELAIELVDRLGPVGATTAAEVAAMLDRAGHDLTRSAEAWPRLVAERVLPFVAPNTFPPLMNPGAKAGVEGRWMAIGPYDVGPGDAVVVSLNDDGADYLGVQLADRWMASLEYADATSSRTAEQSRRAPDGRFHHVIALDDPGYHNWLDPAGVGAGIVHVRLDGLAEEPRPEHQPVATVTTVDRLPEVIPGFAGELVTPAERDAERAARRRHVQLRYGR